MTSKADDVLNDRAERAMMRDDLDQKLDQEIDQKIDVSGKNPGPGRQPAEAHGVTRPSEARVLVPIRRAGANP